MAAMLHDNDIFEPPTWETLSEDTKTERERCLKILDIGIDTALKVDEKRVAQRLMVIRSFMERDF